MVTDAPLFISVAFVGLLLMAIWLIARQARKASIAAGHDRPLQQRLYYGIIAFGIAWGAYSGALAWSGFLYVHASPPRQVLFTTLPLVVLVLFVVPWTRIYKELLAHSEAADLIRLHIFRLLGGLFIALYLVGRLPPQFALIAGTGDLLVALTAYPLAHYVFVKKTLSIRWAYVWNAFGLIDILTAITLVVVLNSQAAAASPEPVAGSILELAKFPFAMGTAFATATIVFLHVSIFRKLAADRRKARTASSAAIISAGGN
jgi:hypothetical protein